MKNLKYIVGVFAMLAFISCEKEEAWDDLSNANKNAVSTGVGGSMAQFTIIGDYLYTIDYKTLKVFHLANASQPELLESIHMGVGMETVHNNNNYLYIGAQDGVHIFDITNPRSPEELSSFEHVTSCDPVIANDEFAFATLRGGMECGGNLTELDVIDVSDIHNPNLVGSVELTNPYGLGFCAQNANYVYVCDGYSGLRLFDISIAHSPTEVMHLEDLEAIDVINGSNDNLIVLTKQGVYQFDAGNPAALVEKSIIPVQ